MATTNFDAVAADTFTGAVVGNITGNVTGNVVGGVLETVEVKSADGAIAVPSASKTVVITKGTAAALTLVDPTAATHDGVRITIMSTTAAAHTVSNAAGSGFNNGGTGSDVGTFGAAIGNNMVVVAYNGKWYVESVIGVTFA